MSVDTILLEGLTLTGRMLAKAPTEGYRLWFDVLATDPGFIYIAEAPTEAAPTDTTFRGVRISLDLATGKPLGKVAVAIGFAWADRSAAGWA